MQALMLIVSCLLLCPQTTIAEESAEISAFFIEFYPAARLQSEVPFEVIFKLRNTGEKPVNPYAEVTLSGSVYNEKDEAILRVTDKRYRAYNLWPGDETGRLRLYIGALKNGIYSLKIDVNAFNRGSNMNISNKPFELTLFIE